MQGKVYCTHQDLNDAAARILSQVGLEDRALVPAADLAHGEQRQLEIAMALAGRPRLLLLDEPTAGMGREDSLNMIELLADLHELERELHKVRHKN